MQTLSFNSPQLILASKSPRRKDLLKQVGISFMLCEADFLEEVKEGERAEKAALRFSQTKAEIVANKFPQKTVLAADTLGDFEGKILQKPKDLEEAFLMLKAMAGKTHKIFTAFTILNKALNKEISQISEAEVLMRPFDEKKIKDYLKTKESLDKAGAYAIQGFGASLVKELRGDFYTVVGLPLFEVITALEEFNIYPLN